MIRNRSCLEKTTDHEVALDCIETGIAAAHPERAVADQLDRTENELIIKDTTVNIAEYSELLIVGGGKAAAQMARIIEDVLDDQLTAGAVVTNDPVSMDRIEVYEGTHPISDENGETGARRVHSLAKRAAKDTLVICLLSGGGSALLPAPAGDIEIEQLQSITSDLLASGATIHEINTVRKHLSGLKGGKLAEAAAPATVVGLILSDVVGNDFGVIASGPITPDQTTYHDARAVLERYSITTHSVIENHLNRGAAGTIPETPRENDSVFERVQVHVLADGFTAIDAARSVAENAGYTPVILSSGVEGEACESAKTHAAIAEESRTTKNPIEPPVAFLSGGEMTVTVQGNGIGGPNQEFVLAGILALQSEDIIIASIDTDGSDGATDAAGAIADRATLTDRTRAQEALAANDVYSYFAGENHLIKTGPTGTNVNDLRILLVPDQE